jgi:tetratricopeptide (TPR) repeat protein
MSNPSSIFVFISFLLLAPGISRAQELLDKSRYDADTARYLYETGNYIAASTLAEEVIKNSKDEKTLAEATLVKWLSLLKVSRTERPAAPLGRFEEAFTEVFSILLDRGDYGSIEGLTKSADSPTADFFHALSLYKNGRFADAEKRAERVSGDSSLFPYARVMLAQIAFIRGDARRAGSLLTEAEKKASGGLNDLLSTLGGYLFFETGDYVGARGKFLTLGGKSPFFKDALEGVVWASVKLEDCASALSFLEKLKPLRLYEKTSQELLLLEAHCNLKIGKTAEARARATEAMSILEVLGDGYQKLSAAPSGNPFELLAAPEGIFDSPEADPALKGLVHSAMKEDAAEISRSLAYRSAIETMKDLHARKQREIEFAIAEIVRSVEAKKEGIREARERVERIRPLLEELSRRVGGRKPPEGAKEVIVKRWEKLLNRTLAPPENEVVEFVLLDGEPGLLYLDNTVYCEILYWMAIDPTKDGRKPGEGILETIVRDTYTARGGGALPFETALPAMSEAVAEKIAHDERMHAKLKELMRTAEKNKTLFHEAEKKTEDFLRAVLKRRSMALRYEARMLTEKAIELLNEIESSEKRGQTPFYPDIKL